MYGKDGTGRKGFGGDAWLITVDDSLMGMIGMVCSRIVATMRLVSGHQSVDVGMSRAGTYLASVVRCCVAQIVDPDVVESIYWKADGSSMQLDESVTNLNEHLFRSHEAGTERKSQVEHSPPSLHPIPNDSDPPGPNASHFFEPSDREQ